MFADGDEVEEILANGGKHSEAPVAQQIAMGDELIARSKEIQALGAFDRSDRSTALDLLGFARQLVFATHSVVTPFHPSSKVHPELRYPQPGPIIAPWQISARKTAGSWVLVSSRCRFLNLR